MPSVLAAAMSICFGEFDGSEFNYGEMCWKEK